MNRISVFSSRKKNPFPEEPATLPLPPRPVSQPPAPQPVAARTRTYTGPSIKPRWSIPLHEQGVLQYTPDELEELYARREEEAQLSVIFNECSTDTELLQSLSENPGEYERCDTCDELIEIDDSRRCPKCGEWV